MSGNPLNDSLKYIKKCEILYVEDDISAQEEIAFFLKNKTKNLFVASNGEEGLELFKKHKPDIVITDIQMPKLDGLEMSSLIKKIDPEVPIIVTTAFTDSNYLFKAIETGINEYLPKPVDLFFMIEKIAKIAKNLFLKKEVEKTRIFLKQYQEAIDKSTLLLKTDKEGRITYINQRFLYLCGFEENELIGRKESVLLEEKTREKQYEEIYEKLNQKKIYEGILHLQTKFKINYIMEATSFPILDENGEIIEFVSIRQDITELYNYRKFLEKQAAFDKRNLLEKTHFINEYQKAIDRATALCQTDLEGKVTFCNDTFAELLGMTKEEIEDKNYFSLMEDKIERNFKKEISQNRSYKTIAKYKTKSGKSLYLNVTFSPITDIRGNIIEIIAMHFNVTKIVELNKEIYYTQTELLFTLGEVVENRSKETSKHIKRVAEYTKLLAKYAGLSEREAEILRIASPMHDIGKVAIPDEILNKPGELTQEEFEIVKKHPLIGYNIFKNSKREIMKAAAVIAKDHHEKFDGTGYPYGKKGEEIHIYGRIVALADVFDALTHDRVYKKAWSTEKVISFIKEQRGKHFDPKLVDIFLEHIDEFIKIKERYKDKETP